MKYVAYYRVSTRKQGRSGLGLEAQREAAQRLAAQHSATIVAEFIEVETGKDNGRPQLKAAITRAQMTGATLVVAKLDRLARKVSFTSTLMDSGLDFVCCDNPHATRFTLHILAAVAEHEAEMISKRTKDALAAAKARGVKLGSAREGHWEGREHLRQAGARKATLVSVKSRHEAARAFYGGVLPQVAERRAAGATYEQIAAELNDQGFVTRTGQPYSRCNLHRILSRHTSQLSS